MRHGQAWYLWKQTHKIDLADEHNYKEPRFPRRNWNAHRGIIAREFKDYWVNKIKQENPKVPLEKIEIFIKGVLGWPDPKEQYLIHCKSCNHSIISYEKDYECKKCGASTMPKLRVTSRGLYTN